MTVKISKATEQELEVVLALLTKQFGEHDIQLASVSLHTAVDAMLQDESLGFFLLAEKDGNLVGFAAISFAWTLEYGGKTAWLDELYVMPAERSAGIGEKLIDAVIAETKVLGCKAIDLEVETGHERAENLYRRKGFHPLKRRRWAKELNHE